MVVNAVGDWYYWQLVMLVDGIVDVLFSCRVVNGGLLDIVLQNSSTCSHCVAQRTSVNELQVCSLFLCDHLVVYVHVNMY